MEIPTSTDPAIRLAAGQQTLTEPATECMTLMGTAQTKAGTGRRITGNKFKRHLFCNKDEKEEKWQQ